VYDFCESRAGEHARAFLGKSDENGGWSGTLVCDDYVAYKALFTKGVKESGCMAHARRKLFELHANHCRRRLNIDPPCRFKFDPGRVAAI
jgi:hypothetical protein